LLSGLGHEVGERDPDWGYVGNAVAARYMRGIHDDVERTPHPERLELRTRRYGQLGGLVSDRILERARGEAAERDRERIWRLFDQFDVLITPVMGGTAVPLRRWEGRSALRILLEQSRFYCFTPVWNHLGNPAASVPAGFSPDGMPLAVQLVGRFGDEATLLSLAAQLEAERPWADRRPPI
ncbi:MAG: amidase family protein, partial [Solirubrobacterales bacterium]